MRRCLAEFIGTFFLVLAVGLTDLAGPLGVFVPGFTLMVIVFAFGHVSLGAFNPAVSLALTLRPNLLSKKAMLAFIIVQLIAGILGSLCAFGFGGSVIPGLGPKSSTVIGFFAELLGSFLLVTSVLNSGTSADYEGNSFFGLGIGGTLLALVPVFGPLSGAVFNPAVGMLSLFSQLHFPGQSKGMIQKSVWIYFTAPFAGAILAVLTFRFISPKDHAGADHLMRGPVDHSGAHSHEHHHHEESSTPSDAPPAYSKLPNNDIN